MPRVGIKPIIPVFGGAKTFNVLDRAATIVFLATIIIIIIIIIITLFLFVYFAVLMCFPPNVACNLTLTLCCDCPYCNYFCLHCAVAVDAVHK
jgi:hypothetical protein